MNIASPKQAYDATRESDDCVLVDVREEEEREGSRIARSLALPLTQLIKEAPALMGNKKIYFICASGGRSMMAAEYMESQGHPASYSVDGGVMGWHVAGLPFEG